MGEEGWFWYRKRSSEILSVEREMREEEVRENNMENGGEIQKLGNMLQQARDLYENDEK